MAGVNIAVDGDRVVAGPGQDRARRHVVLDHGDVIALRVYNDRYIKEEAGAPGLDVTLLIMLSILYLYASGRLEGYEVRGASYEVYAVKSSHLKPLAPYRIPHTSPHPYIAVKPPSTGRATPVMKPASSETSQSAAWAHSSAVPRRPIGCAALYSAQAAAGSAARAAIARAASACR